MAKTCARLRQGDGYLLRYFLSFSYRCRVVKNSIFYRDFDLFKFVCYSL